MTNKLDACAQTLFDEFAKWPIIDTHSHIDPRSPTTNNLEEILGYHYFTELAHSAGMSIVELESAREPRKRCRTILKYLERCDNTTQYSWLLNLARDFLGFDGETITANECDSLFDSASTRLRAPDWTATVRDKIRLERVFLTNAFDDPLEGFDSSFYVPCLRTDDLVFHVRDPHVLQRVTAASHREITGLASLRAALHTIFERFASRGAKACAISLPPDFAPTASIGTLHDDDAELSRAFRSDDFNEPVLSIKIFWMLSELCAEYSLPFDLMIGVNRRVYRAGVPQGQDLFNQQMSLMQYADLFNAFPTVKFPVSVLASAQNQELVAFSWIFPNVLPHGHWWYSNLPTYIESDLRARLSAVPKTKLLGYYSDAYKLEFILPKMNMYRQILAHILAEEYVKPKRLSESDALDLARHVMRTNAESVFG